MESNEINSKEVCDVLNEIMEYELAGVVRYTHSSMMVSGPYSCLLYTSDAADDTPCVDLGGRRIIKIIPYISSLHNI